MFTMEAAALRETLEQLEHARQDHAEWQEKLIGTLLCRLPSDPDNLREDAHRRCRVGRWYHGQVPAELRQQPAFAAIGADHQRLHGIAARILRDTGRGAPVAPDDYDELVTRSKRLRLELASLRHEIQAALRNSDTLTGAYSRSELLPELQEWRELVRRGVQQCCIVFMDLDRFKAINDRFGHGIGDQVLAGAARCVAGQLRPYDKVFRYGGDEFLISLPAADLAAGQAVTERIRKALASTPLADAIGGRTISTTASFGLAMLDPEASVQESIERADTALLLAKSAGRNRAITWNPSIETQRMLRMLQQDKIAG
jgi:diguanylate cyclase (GGDEF)-like protein